MRGATLGLGVALVLLAVASATACDDDDERNAGSSPSATAVAATATVPATAAGGVTGTPTPRATAAPASVASLDGLRCVGRWENRTFGSSGAFAARVEAGGAGGAITLEVGGNVFGGLGGVFEAPFRVEGSTLVIDAHSDFLGHVTARIGLDGRGEGMLSGPPALGARASARIADFQFAENRLRFTLRIDFGDGRPQAISAVDAVCARR